jgi:hypothetical protein
MSGKANVWIMRYSRVILAGVRIGAVVAVAYTVLNAVHPAGVGLQQAVTWGLAYHGQLVLRGRGVQQLLFGA